LLQQVLGYALIAVVLVLVISRTVQGSIISGQVRTAKAGASSSSAKAHGILRSDRALMIGITAAWVALIGSVGAHVQFTWLRWASLAYALCIPVVAILRIVGSILSPRAAKIRVAYLFVMGAYTVFFAYWYVYLLASNAYLSFSIGGVPQSLTSLESVAMSLAGLIANPFGTIMPISTFSRVLICAQQLTVFVLFTVTLALALSRWEPVAEVQDLVIDRPNKTIWRRLPPSPPR
jgi:hypothetical protein